MIRYFCDICSKEIFSGSIASISFMEPLGANVIANPRENNSNNTRASFPNFNGGRMNHDSYQTCEDCFRVARNGIEGMKAPV